MVAVTGIFQTAPWISPRLECPCQMDEDANRLNWGRKKKKKWFSTVLPPSFAFCFFHLSIIPDAIEKKTKQAKNKPQTKNGSTHFLLQIFYFYILNKQPPDTEFQMMLKIQVTVAPSVQRSVRLSLHLSSQLSVSPTCIETFSLSLL